MKENDDEYAAIRLKNQLCFPIYAYSKEIVRRYKPYLDEIDLTYTQYIAMMVMWEHKKITVKEMGELLMLDSGTLTPVLKKLEQKGLVERKRDKEDERVLDVSITKKGEKLQEEAVHVPEKMACCMRITPEEYKQLYELLYKLLGKLDDENMDSD